MNPQLNPDGSITVGIYSVSGGINQRIRPWALTDNQLVDTYGWDSSIDGQRRKRAGWRPLCSFSDAPKGMFSLDSLWTGDAAVYKHYWGIWLQHGETASTLGTSGEIHNPFWDPLSQFTTASFSSNVHHMAIEVHCPNLNPPPEGDELKRTYVMFQAYEHPTNPTMGSYMLLWNLNSTGAAGWTQPLIMPTSAAWLGGRLFISNVVRSDDLATGFSGAGSDCWFSDLYAPATFSHVPVYLEPGLGGRIIALRATRSDDPALLVFKETAIVIFYPRWGTGGGYMSAATDTLDAVNSRVRILSGAIGCLAQRTIKEIPTSRGSDIWFLANDGHVRSLQRVEQDVEAGSGAAITYDQIDFVKRINIESAYTSHAELWDNKYFLAVPLDSASEPNYIAVFDTRSAAMISLEPIAVSSMCVVPYWGDNKLGPHLLAQYSASTTDCSYTGAATGYGIFRLYDDNYYIDPGGTSIAAQEDGPGITFGTLRHKKRWNVFSLMVEASTQATSSIDVSYAISSGQFTSLSTLVFPQATGGRQLYIRKIGLDDIDPDYMIQFRIKSTDGARPSVVYTECTARVIQTEQDNNMT